MAAELESKKQKYLEEQQAAQAQAKERNRRLLATTRAQIQNKDVSGVAKRDELLKAEKESEQELDAELALLESEFQEVLEVEQNEIKRREERYIGVSNEMRNIVGENVELEAHLSTLKTKSDLRVRDAEKVIESLRIELRNLQAECMSQKRLLDEAEQAKKEALALQTLQLNKQNKVLSQKCSKLEHDLQRTLDLLDAQETGHHMELERREEANDRKMSDLTSKMNEMQRNLLVKEAEAMVGSVSNRVEQDERKGDSTHGQLLIKLHDQKERSDSRLAEFKIQVQAEINEIKMMHAQEILQLRRQHESSLKEERALAERAITKANMSRMDSGLQAPRMTGIPASSELSRRVNLSVSVDNISNRQEERAVDAMRRHMSEQAKKHDMALNAYKTQLLELRVEQKVANQRLIDKMRIKDQEIELLKGSSLGSSQADNTLVVRSKIDAMRTKLEAAKSEEIDRLEKVHQDNLEHARLEMERRARAAEEKLEIALKKHQVQLAETKKSVAKKREMMQKEMSAWKESRSNMLRGALKGIKSKDVRHTANMILDEREKAEKEEAKLRG
eukprot:1334312-Amorphochlora_amoeboformis.AAC.1